MSFFRKTLLVFTFAFLSTIGSDASADIVIDGYTDATNDRFTNSGSFIGSGFDFSGVGRRSGWGTLISPNVVIGAAHAIGAGDYHFYEDNDPNGTPVVRTEAARLRIGSSDLMLVALNAAVGPSIAHYDFAQEAITAPAFDANTNTELYNSGSFQNEVAYVFGVSPATSADTRVDQAMGRNRITGYIENLPFQSNTNNDSILFARDMMGDADWVQHETLVQGGDSGAPVFVERNGGLLLIGINSFVTTDAGFSGITYTGNLTTEINDFIALNAVPEPSSATIVVIAGVAVFVRRRRLV